MFLLMSTVGVYASNNPDASPFQVDSPSSEQVTIGFSMNGGLVDAVTVTWTPVAGGLYKIEAMSGDVTGAIITPLVGITRRTDIVPIDAIKVEELFDVNVAIGEL